MKIIAKYLLLICVLVSPVNSNGQESKSSDTVEPRKICMFQQNNKQTEKFELILNYDLGKNILNAITVKNKSVKDIRLFPLLWQSHLIKEFELCEEVVILVDVKVDARETKSLLVRATRYPYRGGREEWMIQWLPNISIDGSEQFQWEFINIADLKKPIKILKWCNDRQFFERIPKFGTSVIQRWTFIYNWDKALGRFLTAREIEIISDTTKIQKIE